MTDIYRYQIISIKGKVIVVRVWSGQSQGLAPDLKVFWVSMTLDFFKYGEAEKGVMFQELKKKFGGKFDYLNRYEYPEADDEKNFGEFVEEWSLDEVVRINDEAYWSFNNNREGYWNSEGLYTVTFTDEKYISHIKEGEIVCGT